VFSWQEFLQQTGFAKASNIYPGIDWLIKVDAEKGLKADYILHPGADVSKIRTEFLGTTALSLSTSRDILYINTPLESFSIGRLNCYTNDGNHVNSNYSLEKDVADIFLDKYDRTKELIIDPTIALELAWATYFGGPATAAYNGQDMISACCIDVHNDFFYFVGSTKAIAFPPLSAPGGTYYWSTNNVGFYTSSDAYIFKTNSIGQNLWCTYFFSSEIDQALDVATDNLGDVYMVGYTFSNINSTIKFPIKNATPPPNVNTGTAYPNQNSDGFIAKFDINGILLWSTTIGNTVLPNINNDNVTAVACDANNDVYICGYSVEFTGTTSNFPFVHSAGNFNLSTYDPLGQNGYIAKFACNPNPSLMTPVWASLMPGQGQFDLTIDRFNNVYTVGWIVPTAVQFSPTTPGVAYKQTYAGGNDDATIFTFTAATNLIWSTYFGGDEGEIISSCDIDENDDRLYVCGYAEADNFVPPNNFPLYQPPSVPTAYYDPTFIISNPSIATQHGFLAAFDASNAPTPFHQSWCTYFGGQTDDNAYNINANAGGNIFMVGKYAQDINPGNPNLFSPMTTSNTNPGLPFYYDDIAPDVNEIRPYIAMLLPNTWELYWCTFYGYVDPNVPHTSGNEGFTDVRAGSRYLLCVGTAGNSVGHISNMTPIAEVPGTSWQQNSTLVTPDGIIAKFNYSGDIRQAGSGGDEHSNLSYEARQNRALNQVSIMSLTAKPENKINKLVLYDVDGRKLISKDESSYQSVLKLPVLSKGIYFLEVHGQGAAQTFKITY
jgi:hypothetical protein